MFYFLTNVALFDSAVELLKYQLKVYVPLGDASDFIAKRTIISSIMQGVAFFPGGTTRSIYFRQSLPLVSRHMQTNRGHPFDKSAERL